MTREERRAKILATFQEGTKNPSGRDPATKMMMKDKLIADLILLGLEELLDFAADIESVAVALRDIEQNTRNR